MLSNIFIVADMFFVSLINHSTLEVILIATGYIRPFLYLWKLGKFMRKIGWTRAARNASVIEAQIRRNMVIGFGIVMIIVSFFAVLAGIDTIEILLHGAIHSAWVILGAWYHYISKHQ